MASPPSVADLVHLRTLTTTLTTTPESSLPPTIPLLLSTIYSSPILDNAFSTASTKNDATTVLLHKLKTRISSLLQSRSPQGKWAGVAMAKACVECSEECLAVYAKTWTPMMVALLGRPELTTIQILALTALSRIFNMLTLNKPTLTREITSQNLKPYIENLLNLLSPLRSSSSGNLPSASPPASVSITDSSTLLPACLRAIAQTLYAHPTTFRPFAKRTQSIITTILSSPAYILTPEVESLAREILISLHLCATPTSRGSSSADATGGERSNTSTAISTEWTRLLRATIADVNFALTSLLTPIIEDPSLTPPKNQGETPPTLPLLPLPPSPSLDEALNRTLLLLRILATFFSLPTPAAISLPLSPLILLTARILTITPRTAHQNPSYSSSARDAVLTSLPQLHIAVLNLLDTIIKRLGGLFLPLALQSLDHVVSIWDSPSPPDKAVRVACYVTLEALVRLAGAGIPRGQALRKLVGIVGRVTEDILDAYTSPSLSTITTPPSSVSLPATASSSSKRKKPTPSSSSISTNLADSLLSPSTASPLTTTKPPHSPQDSTLLSAARGLIVALLTTLSPNRIPSELRTKIDKMAVMAAEREVLLASVLYPPGYVKKSLVTHLVGGEASTASGRMAGWELGIRGVVWPRMPVIRVSPEDGDDDAAEEEEEEEEKFHENVPQRDRDRMDIDSALQRNPTPPPDIRQQKWQQALQSSGVGSGGRAPSPQPLSQPPKPDTKSPDSIHVAAAPPRPPPTPRVTTTTQKPNPSDSNGAADLSPRLSKKPRITPPDYPHPAPPGLHSPHVLPSPSPPATTKAKPQTAPQYSNEKDDNEEDDDEDDEDLIIPEIFTGGGDSDEVDDDGDDDDDEEDDEDVDD